ncbi:MAG TPA: hypothetical protein VGM43_00755 [Bryobacteraceae bacterium]|jgi:predicted HicB family RNase H-like nuclease
MNRKATMHMKINPSLKEQVEKAATKDNRSLSNFIETVLAERTRAEMETGDGQ